MKTRFILVGAGLLLASFISSPAAWAVKVGGVELPDSWSLVGPLGAQALVLNGAGIREYGFLHIPVYAAALYLPARQNSETAILAANSPRVVHMKMLRDVSREDSVKAWEVYLAANCKLPCKLNNDARQNFLKLIPDTRAGDTQTFVFRDGELEIFRNSNSIGAVNDAVVAHTVLASWIGEVPTTVTLKQQLLGAGR